jgi:hypothetical protein
MTKGKIPPRVPGRGLVLYSLHVGDLAAALSRARARRMTQINEPVEIASPANGTRRHATLIAERPDVRAV